MILAISVGLLVALISTVLSLNQRFSNSVIDQVTVRISTLGYALPGAVLAISVYLPLSRIDHYLADFMEREFSLDPGLLITGTITAMVIGLSIRFLAVGYQAIQSSLERVSIRLDEVATIYGTRGARRISKIHLPLLKPSILGAILLVSIDVIKEVPLTLMTRSYGWDTLSVKIFEYVGEGQWHRAALPAVILILVSIVPVYLLQNTEKH